MTESYILKLLKSIQYPGFTRDIVSFGIVKDIQINGKVIDISLEIGTHNQEIIQKLQGSIRDCLTHEKSVETVEISIIEPQTNKESQTHQASKNPFNKKPIPQVNNIIAIASGKGGVGKSTIAANIAACLSKENKVGILDLDIYGPSLPMLIGETSAPSMTEEGKILPIEKFGMQLMSFGFLSGNKTPTIWRGPLIARMTQQFFEDVQWSELDYLILDLPPGTGDVQLTLTQKLTVSGAIIVTTPQALSVLDVQKGADMFRKVDTPVLGIVENMTHFLCPECNTRTKIFPGHGGTEESDRLGVPLLGQIYLTPEIAEASDMGNLYVLQYPDSPVTKVYSSIADKIIKISKE